MSHLFDLKTWLVWNISEILSRFKVRQQQGYSEVIEGNLTPTILFPLHSCRQKVGLPKADVIEPGPQTLHAEVLAPLLSLQLWK